MPGPVFARGERVCLRTIEREDLPFIREHKNDPQVWRSLGWPKPENQPQLTDFFEDVIAGGESTHLLVAVDDNPVGMVSFHSQSVPNGRAELGYWIAPPHQGQGYGTDAVETLVEYGFTERRLHRIEARIFAFNERSRALVERVGFVHEGRKRQAQFIDGQYWAVDWFGLLRREWQDDPPSPVDRE